MSKIINIILLSLTFFLILPVTSHGQLSNIRNQVFVGARPMGLGETFLAVADDGNTIFWNPAGMAWIDRFELQAMQGNIFNLGVKNNYLSFLVPNLPFLPYSGKLAFGLDWSNLNFGDDELSFSQNTFALAAGYRPLKAISFGLRIKYLANNISLDNVNEGEASGQGYDIGAIFSPVPGLNLGIMAYDIGDTRVNYKDGNTEVLFRSNIRYGAAYKFRNLKFIKQPLFAMDIDDRLHLGAECWLQNILGLRMGLQKDIYKHGEDEITFSYGASVRYRFIQFDYALTNAPTLNNTNRFSMNLNFSLPPAPVQIKVKRVRDFYASQFKHHVQDTCSVINVTNTTGNAVDCRIKFRQKSTGISAEAMFTSDPAISTTDSIVLLANLSDQIFKLARNSEKAVYASVLIEPRTFISTKREIVSSPPFYVYGLGMINWAEGVQQAAAFVCPNDKIVKKFASAVLERYNTESDAVIINKNITTAAIIFAALGKYGIRYQTDPHSPFAQLKKALDTIQYPFEILTSAEKRGDCDDTSVLYASLLESSGIRTAFVDNPDHIFIIFDTDIHKNHKIKLCVPEDQYLIINDHIWLPIETTFYGKTFMAAWQEGANVLNHSRQVGMCNITDIHQAWNNRFTPVNFPYKSQLGPIPEKSKIDELFNQDSLTYRVIQDNCLKNYHRLLEQDPCNLKLKNKILVLYNLLGRTPPDILFKRCE